MSERLSPIESIADRIDFNSERLRNIILKDTNGTNALARGWGSILMPNGTYIKSAELVDSSQTPFEPLILLVPPELLGTHEETDPNYIPGEGEPKKGFEGIDFSTGWHGSPLAAACYAVCEGDKILRSDVYLPIFNALSQRENKIGVLNSFEYGDIGILDGHHRRRYAAEGPIKLKYVPVQIIPYLYDSSVVLRTWHADNNYWRAQQVFECFKNPQKVADAKRTKFGVIGKDGVTRRILDTQPNIHIPLSNLI